MPNLHNPNRVNGEDTMTTVIMGSKEAKVLRAIKNLYDRDESIGEAVAMIAETLVGKNRNYVGVPDATAFDNFETVAAIKTALYKGLPASAMQTDAAAILDQVIHKIVRLVRGAEWEAQVGEGRPDASRDLHGYTTLLDGLFIRRAAQAKAEHNAKLREEEAPGPYYLEDCPTCKLWHDKRGCPKCGGSGKVMP